MGLARPGRTVARAHGMVSPKVTVFTLRNRLPTTFGSLLLDMGRCPEAVAAILERYPSGVPIFTPHIYCEYLSPLYTKGPGILSEPDPGMQYCIAYVQYCLLGCMCNTTVCAILGNPLYACPQYYVGASIQMYPGIHATPGVGQRQWRWRGVGADTIACSGDDAGKADERGRRETGGDGRVAQGRRVEGLATGQRRQGNARRETPTADGAAVGFRAPFRRPPLRLSQPA